MGLRRCECCNELFNAVDAQHSDTLCDYCANNEEVELAAEERDSELAADELLERQELEDYENTFGPCDSYEDSYLDAFYEDRYEVPEYDYGGEG